MAIGLALFLAFFIGIVQTQFMTNKFSTSCVQEITSNGMNQQFVWTNLYQDVPYTTSLGLICRNISTAEIVVRKCDTMTRKWMPTSVECAEVQPYNKFCPEELIEIPVRDKYICLSISKQPLAQSQAERSCYGADTLPLADELNVAERAAIFTYLRFRNISEYWLPISQASVNGYEPYTVHLPGKHWGDVYKLPTSSLSSTLPNTLKDKNCLAAVVSDNNSLRLIANDCDAPLHALCVFRKRFVTRSGCPQGFSALSYRPDVCYGIEWEAGMFPLDLQPIGTVEYLDNRNAIQFIYNRLRLNADEYYVAQHFEMDNGSYVLELNSQRQVYISPVLTGEELQNRLSKEVLINRKQVEMTLKMDADWSDLILTVYNRNYIWRITDSKFNNEYGYFDDDDDDEDEAGIKCYTNSDYEWRKEVELKRVWENELQTKTVYKLKLTGSGPGFYWCEAHTIFNFTLIKTPKVVASKRQKGHTYALQYEVFCVPPNQDYCVDVFDELKSLSKYIKKQMNKCKNFYGYLYDNLLIHDVIVMDVVGSSSIEQRIILLCHVSASLRNSAVDNSEEESSEEQDSAENSQGIRHDTEVRMEVYRLLSDLLNRLQPSYASSLRSTDFCFPEEFVSASKVKNQWMLAKREQMSTPKQLCLQSNGLPVMRKCGGDFMAGAQWEPVTAATLQCITDTEEEIITNKLYEIDYTKLSKQEPAQVLRNMAHLLEENMSNLIPADLYYIGRIMQTTFEAVNKDKFNWNATYMAELIEHTSDIIRIYNYLLTAQERVIKSAATLNATNILLESFENLIDRIALETALMSTAMGGDRKLQSLNALLAEDDKLVEIIYYKDMGVTVKIATNFVIFIIDPSVAQITGIATFTVSDISDSESLGTLRGAFEDEYYRFLLANQTVDDLFYEPNIQLATYMPETLWQRLDEVSMLTNNSTQRAPTPPLIIIKLYANGKLFQEEQYNRTHKTAQNKVLSVSIPAHNGDLPEMMPLLMRVERYDNEDNDNDTVLGCNYWNYKTWAQDGLIYLGRSDIDDELVLCGCTHLTPFAYLVGASHIMTIDDTADVIIRTRMIHEEALDVITLLGCTLSMLGIFGIFVTALTFQSWRQKASSKILLQLAFAIAVQMVLFCFVNTEENSHDLLSRGIYSSCVAIGACMHYSVLVQFCWMFITAYLQFQRYVRVFEHTRTTKFLLKYSLLAWGLPLLPVALVLIFDSSSYIPQQHDATTTRVCYPTGYALYFGVILPITAIIVINLIIYVIVMFNILRGPDKSIRHTEKRLIISQIRLSVLLYFLLGFTWIFGLLATMKMGIVFSYLFCLTATLQGFVLFVYFIILDPVTRRLWGNYFVRVFNLGRTYDNSTSGKETTQTI